MTSNSLVAQSRADFKGHRSKWITLNSVETADVLYVTMFWRMTSDIMCSANQIRLFSLHVCQCSDTLVMTYCPRISLRTSGLLRWNSGWLSGGGSVSPARLWWYLCGSPAVLCRQDGATSAGTSNGPGRSISVPNSSLQAVGVEIATSRSQRIMSIPPFSGILDNSLVLGLINKNYVMVK